jgi:hypothetical protein
MTKPAKIPVPDTALESVRAFRDYLSFLIKDIGSVYELLYEDTEKTSAYIYPYDEASKTPEALAVYIKERFNDAPYFLETLTKSSYDCLVVDPAERIEETLDRKKLQFYFDKIPVKSTISQEAYGAMLKELSDNDVLFLHSSIPPDSEVYDKVWGDTARVLLDKLLRAASVNLRDY